MATNDDDVSFPHRIPIETEEQYNFHCTVRCMGVVPYVSFFGAITSLLTARCIRHAREKTTVAIFSQESVQAVYGFSGEVKIQFSTFSYCDVQMHCSR